MQARLVTALAFSRALGAQVTWVAEAQGGSLHNGVPGPMMDGVRVVLGFPLRLPLPQAPAPRVSLADHTSLPRGHADSFTCRLIADVAGYPGTVGWRGPPAWVALAVRGGGVSFGGVSFGGVCVGGGGGRGGGGGGGGGVR